MSFYGGYNFKNFEGTGESVLREIPLPEKILIPLTESLFSGFEPAVRKDDKVQAGSALIKSRRGSDIQLVSSVSGTVTKADKEGIEVVSDGSSSYIPVDGHTREPWHLSHSEVFDIFCRTGCSFLPDRHFSSLKELEEVKHVIINSLHNSPLNQTWTPEILCDSGFFSQGLRVLSAIFPKAEIITATNKRNRKYFKDSLIRKISKVKILADRYPQENDLILTRDLLNKKVVSHEEKPDKSILVLPFSDIIQMAEVMVLGRPLIDKIVLIAGPGVSSPGWYRIRIGTSLVEIKNRLFKSDKKGPWRIISGNPLTGNGLNSLDLSVLPSDSEFSVIRETAVRELFRFMRPGFGYDSYSKSTIAEFLPFIPKKLDTNIHGGVRPCVQCNFCDEVCPVGIYPFLIWKHVGIDAIEESYRLRPYECIECGLCDYVCPSKIDILKSVKKAKNEYLKLRKANGISD